MTKLKKLTWKAFFLLEQLRFPLVLPSLWRVFFFFKLTKKNTVLELRKITAIQATSRDQKDPVLQILIGCKMIRVAYM